MSDTAVLESPLPTSTPAASSAPQPTNPPAPARLIRPRDEAIAHLQTQIQRGTDIKDLRIRNGQELDQARAAKLEWTTQSIELLNNLFDSPSVAEQCNDWVGRIYPEYAEFGNFVEQFYAEMEHRIGRLRSVQRRIERMRPAAGTTGANSAPPPVPAAPGASAVVGMIEPQKLQDELSALLVLRKVDEGSRQALAEFLESFQIDVSIAEQAQDMADLLDRNRFIQFAVVLSGDQQMDQNFELGFCAGRLGMNRVILLNAIQPQQIGAPVQDDRGLTHIFIDRGDGWKLQLARHLRRAGLPIDLNRLA